jgi:hypothetical protein
MDVCKRKSQLFSGNYLKIADFFLRIPKYCCIFADSSTLVNIILNGGISPARVGAK